MANQQMKRIDHERIVTARCPTCPHCGEENTEWWRSDMRVEDYAETEMTCAACDKPYVTTVHILVSFDSRPGAL